MLLTLVTNSLKAGRAIFLVGMWSTLARIVTAITSLMVFPMLMNALGKERYGIWVVIGQTIGFFALSDFGVGSSVANLIARTRMSHHRKMVNAVWTNAIFCLSISSFVLIGLGMIFVPIIINHLESDPINLTSSSTAFYIGVVSFAILMPIRAAEGAVLGFQKFHFPHISRILQSISYFAMIACLFYSENLNLVTLAIAFAISATIGESLNLFWLLF